MIHPALPLACALTLSPFMATGQQAAQGDWPTGEIEAPSGQLFVLHDLVVEENPWSGELQIVVRLLAPMIAGEGLANSELREDMDWACRTWGLSAADSLGTTPDWVVVELMEAPVERGISTPEIRQFFETYRLEGPICIWELF